MTIDRIERLHSISELILSMANNWCAKHNEKPEVCGATKEARKILERMSSGFKDYAIGSGCYLSFPDGAELSVKKANQFLDFILSDTFNDIMREIHQNMKN